MRLFVFYEDIQGNIDNRQNVALHIQIENRSANASAEERKCRCYEIISAQIKQTQTKIMIMVVRWRELNMIHQVNYLRTARSKFDVVLQSFSL